ncbi:MAG: ImmA/IrrE family metallo-endopeptidase [Candidatus Acidiferrales bacterium]
MRQISEIRQKVEKLLAANRVRKPPVPVEKIAERKGLDVRYAPFEGELSGALVRKPDEAFIGVNSLHSITRQRFTIAHELAHFILHEGISTHVDESFKVNWRNGESSKAVNPEEMEANRFAAELLMPTRLIVRDLEELRQFDRNAIDQLARRYKVSSQSMKIRLGNFGIEVPE